MVEAKQQGDGGGLMPDSYKIIKKTFDVYNSSQLDYYIREDTNDLNTILSIVANDEYKTSKMTYSDGDTFVDIGAHIGGWSKLMQHLVPESRVIAVEPIPENVQLLKQNLTTNVHFIPWAIFSRSEISKKMNYGDDSEQGRHHRFIGNVVSFGWGKSVKVPTISLNDLLKDVEKVRVMKMDCEGSEYVALKFASKETLSKIDYIIGEYHNPEGKYSKSRKGLLEACKGVFDDISESQEDTPLGPFWFKNKRLT